MPEPIIDNFDNVPSLPSNHLFSTHQGMESVDHKFDAAGNKFVLVRINFLRSNASIAYVRMYNPQGQFVDHRKLALCEQAKHDDISLDHSGRDLTIVHVGHQTPNPVPDEGRISPCCEGRWRGVWVQYPPGQEQDGGASAFQEPQEPNLTIEEIREVVRYEIERGNGRLADEFDPNGIAAGLRSRPAEGMAWIMDPANHGDPTAGAWQDALFGFVKNAAANPLANVLGGQDAWGRARREELKQIIREVLAEP